MAVWMWCEFSTSEWMLIAICSSLDLIDVTHIRINGLTPWSSFWPLQILTIALVNSY